jgi:parallel beta-helix repeat protein
VGGITASAQNVISGNSWSGVWIENATGNEVLGNLIGTDATGTRSIGNDGPGVHILDSASGNTIGGTTPEARNLIAHNLEEGVRVSSGTQNAILGNSIFSNGLMGIDLGPSDGATVNDPNDPDAGANDLQNFPVLTLASATPTPDVTLEGTFNSLPDADYRIEFFANRDCDPSGCGEGERFLGFTDQHTDPGGDVGFSLVLDSPVSDGESITVTATDAVGNTSEFGDCLVASCSSLVTFGDTLTATDGNTLGWTTPADIRFAKGDLADIATFTTTDDGWMLGASSLDLSADVPGPGDGLYYLVKPLGCGSWQTAMGAEPDRDAGLP